ncbi:hypothetical protein [Flavobacterium psychrotrophum]|uniref:hypothetical protein n=1 Tax=Flavobacterium psychrotrophum TaxID=2294119 RepID=UPI000E315FF9|nr:hypothetical protein [Flavobacterium psychrotrophum]
MRKIYQLKENLDIPGQNFIVKKGTLAEVNYVFDIKDNDIPTQLGLNFENINGTYTIEESFFNDLIFSENITFLESKFNEGDCVKNDNLGTGTVISVEYKDYSLKGRYYYWVKFTDGDYYTAENFLDFC